MDHFCDLNGSRMYHHIITTVCVQSVWKCATPVTGLSVRRDSVNKAT